MSGSRGLTTWILIGMLSGVVCGYLAHVVSATPEQQQQISGYLSVIAGLFLRLIKMIIAPLVFATLVAGVAHMKDASSLGRMGLRAMLWFIAAGFVSILLGIIMVRVLEPGTGLQLELPQSTAAGVATTGLDLKQFITNVVPTSIFDAMAKNELLQIVVFSLFAGLALATLGERVAPLTRGADALVELMLQITGYVMRTAPIGVFAAIAAVVTTQGLGILVTYSKYIASFYLGLLVLWALLLGAAYIVLGHSITFLLRKVREPLLLGFATASSEAAYPKLLEQLKRAGVPGRIAGFVLPLGYSFNLDGGMMYCAFALMFIAQAYGIELSFAQQVTMLLLLMVATKGLAGVPRGSLVVIAASLPHFNLPDAGVLLLLGVDHLLDMGRTATNVLGNSVATAAVARWEGAELGESLVRSTDDEHRSNHDRQ